MGFSRQEYWHGVPFPPPWDRPNPGIELTSPALPGGFFNTVPPGKSQLHITIFRYTYMLAAAAAAKSLQSCPTLCDTIDGSPPGSPVPGTLQARTLEWIAGEK